MPKDWATERPARPVIKKLVLLGMAFAVTTDIEAQLEFMVTEECLGAQLLTMNVFIEASVGQPLLTGDAK